MGEGGFLLLLLLWPVKEVSAKGGVAMHGWWRDVEGGGR